ncbi:MAG: pyrroloquinoline quinone biosynthesis protein B [Saprospiraceae bacterium]|jgi:pyrroloquinoline quinone biosynthesis protein B
MKNQLLICLSLLIIGCTNPDPLNEVKQSSSLSPNITVLGIAQDAGYPQADCKKGCCKAVWKGEVSRKMVSCIALIDPPNNKAWIFDATPDFKDQLQQLQLAYPGIELAGIFLTHAHIGHYTGLMHLGREAMGAKEIPVYAMPKMKNFLETNGPWSQLVNLKNITLQSLQSDSTILIGGTFKITPLQVPHRDEYSETVGYKIEGPQKSGLFIPDIDKWQKWDRDILEEIRKVDYAFLDGSFYKNGEIPGRDMALIPHPFIEESLKIFSPLPESDRSKVHFIHFNHTNPVLQSNSEAYREVSRQGFKIAGEGKQVIL